MRIDPKVRLRNFIKDSRELSGLNQKEFAKALGIAQARVSEWESGKVEPSATQLFKIADLCNKEIVLGERPDYLSNISKDEKDS